MHIFSTSQLPRVVRTWCALYMLTSKCASRHISIQFLISHLARWLCTSRFSKPSLTVESGRSSSWLNTLVAGMATCSKASPPTLNAERNASKVPQHSPTFQLLSPRCAQLIFGNELPGPPYPGMTVARTERQCCSWCDRCGSGAQILLRENVPAPCRCTYSNPCSRAKQPTTLFITPVQVGTQRYASRSLTTTRSEGERRETTATYPNTAVFSYVTVEPLGIWLRQR